MFYLSEEELEQIAEGQAPLNLGLFGLCFGTAATSLTALFTTSLPEKAFLGFCAFLAVTFLGSIYFGFRALGDHRRTRNRLKRFTGKTT